ncbi:hypothetical protein PFISCL1PPCAC_3852, partial [Pristionchus fissidentatus]
YYSIHILDRRIESKAPHLTNPWVTSLISLTAAWTNCVTLRQCSASPTTRKRTPNFPCEFSASLSIALIE